jgi:CheY-like chemotaxis protein
MLSRCVLIVDDDESVGQSLALTVESVPSTKAIVVRDGRSALGVLEDPGLRIDALITDLHLPYVDGYELILKLRVIPRYNRLPVFLITADANWSPPDGDTVKGPNVVIRKPFSTREVRRVLEQMLA